ncbi:MAG: hypothetical protein ACKOX6_00920 [Bdellovibrio sp.]
MTLPTGQISASDFNNELRRAWNQPLSADDFTLRSILGRQYQRIETSAGEYRGRYLYPPNGTILQYGYCKGYDLMKLVADGNGGSYEWVIEANSVQCGWSPPPTNNNPPDGTLLQQYCDPYGNLVGYFADGRGGGYEMIMEYGSPSCATHVNG